MKIKIPVIIEDQYTQRQKGIGKPIEFITVEDEVFLSGPVSNRLAVLDFDENGVLREGVKYIPSTDSEKPGIYEGLESNRINNINILSDGFMQVNVFGVAYRTIEMFEEADTLGRKIKWAFNSPQLLLVPKAGSWANAFYQRDSHSIQFFYFPSVNFNKQIIYTSLSHDIISHETGHAILDSIAPDLYHSITPQSLALHESIADLTALILSFKSKPLRETVLRQTNGMIEYSTAFSRIAMEFGVNTDMTGNNRPLRNLVNNKRLPDKGPIRTEPHELSEVLSGALFAVMVKMFHRRKEEIMKEKNQDQFQVSGLALFEAGEQFKRMIFRALDYLPPGEISFADYGRAIIAADKASHPDDDTERKWIAEEFKKRNIVKNKNEITDVDLAPELKLKINNVLFNIDLDTFIESDWVAYDFVNKNKVLLGIPADVSCEIRPRSDIRKKYYHKEGPAEVRECLLKITWKNIEKNPQSDKLPSNRIISQGITIAIDWETKQVRSFLRTDKSDTQKGDRDNMLLNLEKMEMLRFDHETDNIYRPGLIPCTVIGDTLKVKNTAQMLHLAQHH